MTRGSPIPGKAANRASHPSGGGTTTVRLRQVREARGIGASEMARRVGVSRQTIYAIESGDYVPNTTVALQLARVLEVSVEDLFSIPAVSEEQPAAIRAELLAAGGGRHSAGELVRLGRVGPRTVAAPAARFPTFLADGDGVIETWNRTGVTIRSATEPAPAGNCLVIAGCDPALSVLAGEVESAGTKVIMIPCSSREALGWLQKGLVHVAGTHLRDHTTGEYNLPLLASLFRKGSVRAVTFAEWEEGLVVRRGNPKRIRSVADLGGGRIAIVNRERGSGARDLLDSKLRDEGIQPRTVAGYDRVVPSHLAGAFAVANSEADCCVATVSAARCLGLDFVPLSEERFDLIVASPEMSTGVVRALFDALNRASLRRKLAVLAGYEVRHTGDTLM